MLLTTKEVAALLSVTGQTVRTMAREGAIPFLRFRTSKRKNCVKTIYRFDKEKILNFIDTHSNPDKIDKP